MKKKKSLIAIPLISPSRTTYAELIKILRLNVQKTKYYPTATLDSLPGVCTAQTVTIMKILGVTMDGKFL